MQPKKSKKPLTRNQSEVLEWVRGVIEVRGVEPTLCEIANEFSICLASASRYVSILAQKGHIKKGKGNPFSIEIIT